MRAPSVQLVKRKRAVRGGPERWDWVLRWPKGNGRGLYNHETIGVVGEMTTREAGKLRKKKEQAIGGGKVLRDSSGYTLAQFLEADRAHLATTHRPATVQKHATASGRLLAVVDGGKKIETVGHADVAAFQHQLANGVKDDAGGWTWAPCSPTTIRTTIGTLKAAFARAQDRGFVTANPFAVRLPKAQARAKRILTDQEIAAMIDAAPNIWWATFIRLGFTTALRLGEMLNLMWTDIDRDRLEVHVTAKRPGTFTHAGEDWPILAWEAKSHQERTVPLVPDILPMLDRLRVFGGGSEYVFLTLPRLRKIVARIENGKPPTPSKALAGNLHPTWTAIQADARAMIAQGRKAAVEAVPWKRASIHDLRKSGLTALARAGVPLNELRDLAGHADVATTVDYYTAPGDDLADRVRARFAVPAG